MGNQPNTFIQCGLDNTDTRQEVLKTTEEAARGNKKAQIFGTAKGNVPDLGLASERKATASRVVIYSSNPRESQQYEAPIKQISLLPEHENLTSISKLPRSYYIKRMGCEYYEQQRGKCLDEIIESRYNTNMHFPQYQIRGLLECLVYSLAYLSHKQIKHHDFYPTNIFYKDGKFKLLNPLLLAGSGYELTQQRKRFSFLSPELIIEVLNDRGWDELPFLVKVKADVYSIGMVMLEYCTLLPSSQCYDPETYSILDELVAQRIEKVAVLYNPLIATGLKSMLQHDIARRITPKQLSYSLHYNLSQHKEEQQLSRVAPHQKMSMSVRVPQQGPERRGQPIIPNLVHPTQNNLAYQEPVYIHEGSRRDSELPQPIVEKSPPARLLGQLPFPAVNPYQNFLQGPPTHLLQRSGPFPPSQMFLSEKTEQEGVRLQSMNSRKQALATNDSRFLGSANMSAFRPSSPSNSGMLSHEQVKKLNPFELIQQQYREEEDNQKQKDTGMPSSFSKPSDYTFRHAPPENQKARQQYSKPNGQRQETLDERVRKILEASKNIA